MQSVYSLLSPHFYLTPLTHLFPPPSHGHRNSSYGPFDYFGEVASLIQLIASNDAIPVKNNLIGPSVATGDWTPEMVWDTGFITSFASSMGALAVEQYVSYYIIARSSTRSPLCYHPATPMTTASPSTASAPRRTRRPNSPCTSTTPRPSRSSRRISTPRRWRCRQESRF